ncbi:MAG: 1-(5-phosphoribosyl)-5-[(5-phosphoribosylamino)methylideneamino]imidazole-4-carboxamide isomerase [Muribaculaceae bacterium]|nr:1-(5-phosphoribosyl)-5-[(5-phosphoribosylamino)methylideneamino]imidazole-4-carboxamide isomerase [Muribaculaceae bacterium]
MQIIPAIDIMDGRCIRLSKGRFDTRKVYYDNPEEAAAAFAGAGLTRLHIVDLDGARKGESVNIRVLERIASRYPLAIDYSGGIRSRDDIVRALDAGASMVSVGSVAVNNPALMKEFLYEFGAERIILSSDIDARGLVAVRGWEEESPVTAKQLLEIFAACGLDKAIVTEIARDGMLCGVDTSLYTGLAEAFPSVDFIASGGVASVDDLMRCNAAGIAGVIVGKAFYEGHIALDEMARINSM